VVVLVAFFVTNGDLDADGTPSTTVPTAPDEATPPAAPPAETRSAAQLLTTLAVTAEGPRSGYEREAFGEGWTVDGNGCDVRDRVLADESLVPVTLEADGCSVAAGEWSSLYDGYSTPDPGELEIDHMVPLAEAWDSGAATWSPPQREKYANDMDRDDALVAVTAATNQSKSDRDPAEWMPPKRESWCRYVNAWIAQKSAWKLTVDPAERDALHNVLATC
jgi:hypothetical protein